MQTLARLAKRAAPGKRVVGVARFSEKGVREKLAGGAIECVEADLLERKQIEALPKLPNVVFMAGRKIGSSGHEDLTWAMNALVPAMVADADAWLTRQEVRNPARTMVAQTPGFPD